MSGDIHEQTGAYALDALPPDEREEFERHLASCEPCRREVDDFREVVSRLDEMTAVPAPAWLRAEVLETIAAGEAAEVIQWATRRLLAAGTRADVADAVLDAIRQLGGWTVPAVEADDRALPVDVSFGRGGILLPVAPDLQVRRTLERYLPQLVEDAHQALQSIRGLPTRDPSGVAADPNDQSA